MFLIEVLAHASFFVIFLTIFYITFVSYTQQRAMISDINLLFKDSTQTLTLISPASVNSFFSNILSGTQTIADPIIGQVSASIDASNKKVLAPFMIYGFGVGIGGILLSMALTAYYGGSAFELFYTNVISLSIIVVTELAITTLYGQFRLLDNQYLSALFALKASGGTPDCNVVGQTLNSIFPGMGLEKLI